MRYFNHSNHTEFANLKITKFVNLFINKIIVLYNYLKKNE